MTDFRAPRPIAAADPTSRFDCGEPSLNDWLSLRALRNETSGSSRTFVSVTTDTGEIAGYYCLSANSLSRADAQGALARNVADPIPVVLIGRLAVDRRFGGQGLGYSLLQHAVLQAVNVAATIGVRAILVHALSKNAAGFYEKFGFTRFPGSSQTLYLLTKDALRTLGDLS